MRPVFSILLIAALVFSGSYFYLEARAICQVPLPYRIGILDEQFDLSFEEARVALSDAEAAWEDATERNLFTYDEGAEFAINFIFDERQAFADAEEAFRDRLDQTENLSGAIQGRYDDLVATYEKKSLSYERAVGAYEARLAAYNQTVADYNAGGGAPREAFLELETEQLALDAEQNRLNQQVTELNQIVEEINEIGSRGNQLIDTYNRGVETFNDTFGAGREFTQGDYTGDAINIYTFADGEELRLVLVHELGHALSLDHVMEETATMHYLLGAQSGYTVTDADLTAFNAICNASTIERIQLLWNDRYYR